MYNGGRTTDLIVEWMTAKTGPPSTEVDCSTMESKTSDDKLALSYFGESTGALWDAFNVAGRHPVVGDKISFYHTSDVACGELFGLSGSGVTLSRAFDANTFQYDGDETAEALTTWANITRLPILMTFGLEYIEPIFQEKTPALILFTQEHGQAYQRIFEQAAHELNGEILFVTSGISEKIQRLLGEFYQH